MIGPGVFKRGKKPAQGIKHDEGKPPLDLIDAWFLEDVAAVLHFGAAKYGLNNYQKGMSLGKALASTLRHTFAILKGEYLDTESKMPHAAHAVAGLMFTHYFIRTGKIMPDDRYKDSK
jgi:hypothetical protein